MVNVDTASARNGADQSIEATLTSPALPAFVSVEDQPFERASVAESSTSKSIQSATSSQNRNQSQLGENQSSRSIEDGRGDTAVAEMQRRRKNRSSGGFLLDSTNTSSRLSRLLHADPSRVNSRKGKRTSNDSSLIDTRVEAIVPNPDTHGVVEHPLSSIAKNDGDAGSRVNDTHSSNLERSGISENTENHVASIGFDTDPAQIVDMALRLSEGRRRQASAKRFVPETPTKGRGIDADNEAKQRVSYLGQYLAASPSRSSRSTPPRQATMSRDAALPPENSVRKSRFQNLSTDGDVSVEVSKATAARVQAARTYLELAHEHRRLLDHLPPIHAPNSRRPSKAEYGDSKAYNPLQYARNRKLRLREKSGLQTETAGWHDVAAVRSWVDAVVDSHPASQWDSVDCARLPPFSTKTSDSNEQQQQELQFGSPSQQKPVPTRRPKSDWVTHPADLLADAYWLEQGLNKTKIQDRDNKNIYPADTQFKYPGWRRNAAPVSTSLALQQSNEAMYDQSRTSQEIAQLEKAPELPNFRSAHAKETDGRRLRKSGKKLLKETLKLDSSKARPRSSGSASSTSSSSSGSNTDDAKPRGRRRRQLRSKFGSFNLPEGDPFARPLEPSHKSSIARNTSDKPRSIGDKNLLKAYKQETSRESSADRGKPSNKRYKDLPADRNAAERSGRSSGEYDATTRDWSAGFVLPSIVMNLSPPRSRSSSLAGKARGGTLSPINEKGSSRSPNRVDANDFAITFPPSHTQEADIDLDGHTAESRQGSRGTSPMTRSRRSSSPMADKLLARPDNRASIISRSSFKSTTSSSDPSRIRGIFKGGRIAEIVGNEVSRVNDYIWKREPPMTNRGLHSRSKTSLSIHSSDTDEAQSASNATNQTPSSEFRRSMSIDGSPINSPQSAGSHRSEYSSKLNNPNLPSFTSPFQRDRQRQERNQELLSLITPGNDGTSDPVSAQAAQLRSRSKSPRFDRLAPPRLDTSGGSLRVEPGNDHGFGSALDLTDSRTASQTYNDAIRGESDRDFGPTSAAPDFSQHVRKSVTDTALLRASRDVDRRDLRRIETLLMMSAVQARAVMLSTTDELARPDQDPKLGHGPEQPDARLRKYREHVSAAKNYISKLENQHWQFKNSLDHFSTKTIGGIQGEMQVLEDTLENILTPRVRAAADNAGELSIKLSTSSTLAVRGVNDIISEALRRRRRGPLRWLRRFGYGAIAWGVVGLLWIIWAVVICLKVIIGVFKGSIWFVRWIFWVN